MVKGTVTCADSNQPLPGVNVVEEGTSHGVITDLDGKYEIELTTEDAKLKISFLGYSTELIKVVGRSIINIQLVPDMQQLEEVVVIGYGAVKKSDLTGSISSVSFNRGGRNKQKCAPAMYISNYDYEEFNTEGYSTIHENGFKDVKINPLSTFSIDVDAASYSNIRRFINYGQKPPIDAVRIEEMVNYFTYDYPQPEDEHPFSINYEVGECPWNKNNKLLHIGLQGEDIPTDNLPPSNLVFLIDVSGSMGSPNKLPLLKSAFKLLVNELRPNDRVAIVVYAGASGLVLPSTKGSEKDKIIDALDKLHSGGSTAGAAGLRLAYNVAEKHFMEEGNNRIILATDGDFNVGQSSNAEMERLIEKEKEKGIFISVLGFGMGNYKDDKMEIIADKGNGNYAYIDNIQEAEKVFVNEFGGTLFTIAKDVKIQIEFNPVKVKEYRLVGYENRLLNEEDFDNDKIDAGELGSGHTVTALYELVISETEAEKNDRLKYQTTVINNNATESNELATIKFRYKKPDGVKSQLIEEIIMDNRNTIEESSDNFRFSAAVAEFGMLLRDSEYLKDCSFDDMIQLAQHSKGKDEEGYRGEFIRLIKTAKVLK
ncbi:von Willebrand factor type A domain-containing protein [Bacteroidota bacterium]